MNQDGKDSGNNCGYLQVYLCTYMTMPIFDMLYINVIED